MKYLRPFLLKHQQRLDQIADGTSCEINRLLLRHQPEIQFVKVALQKSFVTVYQILRDMVRPSQLSTSDAPHGIVTRDAFEETETDSD